MIANFAASALVLAMTLGSVLAAEDHSSTATTIHSINTSPECVAAITAAEKHGVNGISADVCTATVTTASGRVSLASTMNLETVGLSPTSPDLAALFRAVAAGTVQSKPYSQTISQITDRETQKGIFYYDGNRAWVTETYRGYTGSHSCNVDYAIGYSVSNTACSDSGGPGSRKLQMNWAVSLAVKGGPIAWTESFTMHLSADGTISNG